MPKIIIGLVGLAASGKEVAKKYLQEKYGAGGHRFSTILRDILNRLYLPVSRENLQNLSSCLRDRFGGDVLARVMAEEAKNEPKSIVVIDGVRRLDDIVYLKKLPGWQLVAVDADPEIRYQRLIKRNENAGDAKKTYTEFRADEEKEAEQEIPRVLTTADQRLDNNASLQNFYRQIDGLVAALKKDYV